MWKAAGKRDPPTAAADISKFGWEVRGGVVSQAIHTRSPDELKLCENCHVCAGMCREWRVAIKQTHTMHHILQVYRTRCVQQSIKCGHISIYRR